MPLTPASSAAVAGAAPIEYVTQRLTCNATFELPRHFCGVLTIVNACGTISVDGGDYVCANPNYGYYGPTSNSAFAKGAQICATYGCGLMTGYYFD